MTNSFHYRAMRAADLAAACQLWAESEGIELAEGDSLAELTQYLQRNPDMSQVALDDTRLVGAVLAGHDGRRGFLYHLAVEKRLRGAGVGRELVTRAIGALETAGVSRVLILVARDNAPGRAFWLSRGWEALVFAEPMGRDL